MAASVMVANRRRAKKAKSKKKSGRKKARKKTARKSGARRNKAKKARGGTMARKKSGKRRTKKKGRKRGGRKAKKNSVRRRARSNPPKKKRRRSPRRRSRKRGRRNPSRAVAVAGTKLKNLGKSHGNAAIPVIGGGALLFAEDAFIDKLLLKLPGTPTRNEPIGMGYRALAGLLLGMGVDMVMKNKKVPGMTFGEFFRNVLYIKIVADAGKKYVGPKLSSFTSTTVADSGAREFIPGDVKGVNGVRRQGVGRSRIRDF